MKLICEKIEKVYGNPPIMKNFKREDQGHDEYFAFITFFDPPFTLLFAAIHDLVVFFSISIIKYRLAS